VRVIFENKVVSFFMKHGVLLLLLLLLLQRRMAEVINTGIVLIFTVDVTGRVQPLISTQRIAGVLASNAIV